MTDNAARIFNLDLYSQRKAKTMTIQAKSMNRSTLRYPAKETHAIAELMQHIAQSLVDHPEAVRVNEVEGNQITILELKVAPSDLGKAIGRGGRTAQAMRTILNAAANKIHRRISLEILEPEA
jgi:hypothetical protein